MAHKCSTLLVLAAFLPITWLVANEPDTRPNILLITADDLGNQLSCYGDTRLQTPRLDALREGMRFTRAYVTQSSCSSSRASILTGLYPHQNGQYGLAHLGFRMRPGQKNVVAMLHSAGYRTGLIGKLHVEPSQEYPFDWQPKPNNASRTRHVRWVAEQSREFFASARKSGQPFFYYVNYFDPHGPYTPDVRQVEGLPKTPTDPETVDVLPLRAPNPKAYKRVTALIYDCIARVDIGTGMLLDELKTAGFAKNTLVIFIGDNGAAVNRGKMSSYEPGVQVPLLVRWPDNVRTEQVRDELVSAVDIMPTVLHAAGIPIPERLAGRSLEPLFLEQRYSDWRQYLFTEMNFHTANAYRPQRTVRNDQFKLILNLEPSRDQDPVELYDLKNDPGETKNLANDPTYVLQFGQLEEVLQQWRQRTNDPLLDPDRRKRWSQVAQQWVKSAPCLDRGPYPNVASVPPGGLELLK